MDIRLAYGKKTLTLTLPDGLRVDQYGPVMPERVMGYEDFVAGLESAGGELFFSGLPPLIVVNDAYRNTPTPRILEWLNQFRRGVLDKAHFLIATGTHHPPTRDQYYTIFGEFRDSILDRIAVHDANDLPSMVKVGEDRLHGGVWLNKLVVNSEKVFVIGSVEPHYFAGYTGGRKSLFPGLTDQKTVERNHNLANSLEAAPLRLKGNPVADHLEQMMRMINPGKFFTVQTVNDSRADVFGLFFGRLDRAFADAATLAGKIYARRVPRLYDALICEILPPLDRDLYQAQKAVENCQRAVRDGGTLVVVSPCDEGVGSRYFFDLAANWDVARNASRDGKLHFGSHKLSRVVSIKARIDVRLHSDLPDDTARQVFYEPLADVSDFIKGQAARQPEYAVGVVRDAGGTVLTL
jgi:nickel-dependent lactate racemase